MAKGRDLMTSMAAVAVGKGATAIAGLLTITLLTRSLGPNDFGYYRTALTFAALSAVFADLGIYLVGLREMTRPGADVQRVVGNALALRLFSSMSVLLVASLIGLLMPYDRTVKEGIFIGALVYTAFQGGEFLVSVFQLFTRQAGSALADAAGAVVTVVCVWVLTKLDAGVLPMLCATLFGAASTIGISWVLARRLMPFHLRFELPVWRKYVVTGLPVAGSRMLSLAMLRGDTLLLSLFKPASHVGIYGVPTKMFELTTQLPYLFGGLMMPLLAAAAAKAVGSGGPAAAAGESDSPVERAAGRTDFIRLLGRSLDAMLVYGVGIILALAVFAPQLLSLISGEEFVSGAPALVILSFASLMAALSIIVRFSLIALDRTRSVLLADGVACAIALVAYFVLIPLFSYVGAAIGTAVAETSVLIAMLWSLQASGMPLPRLSSFAKTVAAGVTAAGGMWLAAAHMSVHWLLALVAGGVIYVVLLALTGAVPKEFVDGLRKKRQVGAAASAADS